MNNIIISAESTCGLNKDLIEKYNISQIGLTFMLNDEEHNDLDGKVSSKEFYDAMRKNAQTKTSQINEETAREYLSKLLESGKDILHISFSSGLSGTCNNFKKVADELNKTHKNQIAVVDSLCACGGHGLLVVMAAKKAQTAKDLQELTEYTESIKLNICHIFTVDDLKYLYHGGRVKKSSYIVGTLLQIKPVMHVDNEGHLVAISKKIGRKKAVNELMVEMENRFMKTEQTVFINHADCLEDALALSKQIEEKFNIKPVVMDLGFVIGAHSGPGTLSLFFVGRSR